MLRSTPSTRQKITSVFCAAILCLVFIDAPMTRPAHSETREEASAFKPLIKKAIQKAVIPGYEELTKAVRIQEKLITTLCQTPSVSNLAHAHEQFRNTVNAWSAVEMYRLGPALKNNRQEKIFFWPDRKSIGLRQVRKLIETNEPTALNVETLQKKSVAVQGLLALEYVLFGKGSEDLNSGSIDSYRCRYGVTISQAIASTSQDIINDWNKKDGFRNLMLNASVDNPVYRTDGEAIQDFIRVGSEMIQSTRDLKIKNTIKSEPVKSKAKRAPFWRSNLTLTAYQENLRSVDNLFTIGGLGSLTPRYTKSLSFELGQTNKFLKQLEDKNLPWIDLVKNEEAHDLLSFVTIPLDGAQYVTNELIPQELGLSLGFNSLDGD